MDKAKSKVEDMRVTLDLEGGQTVECRVLTSFDVIDKSYVALMPLTGGNVMLYRLMVDEENNPTVHYIEDDNEYEAAVAMFELVCSRRG